MLFSYTEHYGYSMNGFIICFLFIACICGAACVGEDLENEPKATPPVIQPEGGTSEPTYYDDPYDCYTYECEPQPT